MNRPHDKSTGQPSGANADPHALPVESTVAMFRRRRSKRRIALALTVSLLGGIGLIWAMQKPPEDAVESHTVHITPADTQEMTEDRQTELERNVPTAVESVAVDNGDRTPFDLNKFDLEQPVEIGDLISQSLVEAAEHPLDPVLAVARLSMQEIDSKIDDYTCVITSQVFIDGRLDKERRMKAKIRHASEQGDPPTPFAVHLDFLSPRSLTGQEVIWVEGQNDGKLIAHAGSGFLRLKRMHLAPDGPIAMRGSKYPIWDIGFRNLIGKMYDIGCCDRDDEDCEVIVTTGVKVEGRACTLIEIKHEQEKECFQFHHAKIYVDNERKIPIGYEGYAWPTGNKQKLPLMEKFYYTDVDLNVGLVDDDFDPDNPRYRYPSW